MVVNDFDLERVPVFPTEADPPSLVDPDAVLTLPVPFQNFEMVAGRHHQVPENARPMKVQKLPPRGPFQRSIACPRQIVKQSRGCLVSEGLDHNLSILRDKSYVKCNTCGMLRETR
jgi:hypothetical protein